MENESNRKKEKARRAFTTIALILLFCLIVGLIVYFRTELIELVRNGFGSTDLTTVEDLIS